MDLKKRYLLMMAVVILLTVVFFVTSTHMLDTKKSDIRKIDKRIKKAQEELNSAEVLSGELHSVATVIQNSMSKDKDYLADEINDFAKKLAALADDYKIAVFSITPKDAFSAGHLIEHQYTMSIHTTYVQLGEFLTKLESFDELIKIQTLDVRPVQDKKKSASVDSENIRETQTRYRVTLELSTFKILKEV
ncbi:MAG: type 4a pilus biogenesis protein PilO [Candidatus Cloacimonetes bacterium]|nr:type 4a pilus biogenesis protein PilO [Candidatus Cloacimonadota bacterium]